MSKEARDVLKTQRLVFILMYIIFKINTFKHVRLAERSKAAASGAVLLRKARVRTPQRTGDVLRKICFFLSESDFINIFIATRHFITFLRLQSYSQQSLHAAYLHIFEANNSEHFADIHVFVVTG